MTRQRTLVLLCLVGLVTTLAAFGSPVRSSASAGPGHDSDIPDDGLFPSRWEWVPVRDDTPQVRELARRIRSIFALHLQGQQVAAEKALLRLTSDFEQQAPEINLGTVVTPGPTGIYNSTLPGVRATVIGCDGAEPAGDRLRDNDGG